jgi:hypothetical protein
MRVTDSPSSSAFCVMRYVTAFWYPVNGWSTTVILVSHFTWVIPYQPGTTSRAGAPCCKGSGCPFMVWTTSTSGRMSSSVNSADKE